MRDYEARKAEAEIQSPDVVRPRVITTDEPPKIARTTAAEPAQGPSVDTSALRPKRKVEGPQVEGFLTMMDCTRGLTLHVRIGNGNVRLHTADPSKVEFTSYVTSVTEGIECGPVKPELRVLITYRRSNDPSILGEPLLVEFLD
jgi:hypothetical protein